MSYLDIYLQDKPKSICRYCRKQVYMAAPHVIWYHLSTHNKYCNEIIRGCEAAPGSFIDYLKLCK